MKAIAIFLSVMAVYPCLGQDIQTVNKELASLAKKPLQPSASPEKKAEVVRVLSQFFDAYQARINEDESLADKVGTAQAATGSVTSIVFYVWMKRLIRRGHVRNDLILADTLRYFFTKDNLEPRKWYAGGTIFSGEAAMPALSKNDLPQLASRKLTLKFGELRYLVESPVVAYFDKELNRTRLSLDFKLLKQSTLNSKLTIPKIGVDNVTTGRFNVASRSVEYLDELAFNIYELTAMSAEEQLYFSEGFLRELALSPKKFKEYDRIFRMILNLSSEEPLKYTRVFRSRYKLITKATKGTIVVGGIALLAYGVYNAFDLGDPLFDTMNQLNRECFEYDIIGFQPGCAGRAMSSLNLSTGELNELVQDALEFTYLF